MSTEAPIRDKPRIVVASFPAAANVTVVHPGAVVTVPAAAAIFGLSEGAIRKRIARGLWLEGREWKRAPDGGIWIITGGVKQWVMGTE